MRLASSSAQSGFSASTLFSTRSSKEAILRLGQLDLRRDAFVCHRCDTTRSVVISSRPLAPSKEANENKCLFQKGKGKLTSRRYHRSNWHTPHHQRDICWGRERNDESSEPKWCASWSERPHGTGPFSRWSCRLPAHDDEGPA
jgi:hypothetical protein